MKEEEEEEVKEKNTKCSSCLLLAALPFFPFSFGRENSSLTGEVKKEKNFEEKLYLLLLKLL